MFKRKAYKYVEYGHFCFITAHDDINPTLAVYYNYVIIAVCTRL